jgi:hypothetical protein
MIIVRLCGGGLGNQMFQYAAGRRLSLIHKTPLRLDLEDYTSGSFRQYDLDKFNIRASKASWFDFLRVCPAEALKRLLIHHPLPRGRALQAKLLSGVQKNGYRLRTSEYDATKPVEPLMIGRVVAQRFFHFDPEVLTVPNNVALVGSWISAKYFADVEPVIRKELAVVTPLDENNRRVAEQIRNTPSVSLHVRRGDKADNPVHPGTEPEFVTRAIQYMSSRIAQPHFFVFSDDIEWCKQVISYDGEITFMDFNGDRPHDDLRLMALCRHNIIAESTFSWWAAWLNDNPGKIVVSPPARRTITLSNFDTKDVLPPEWIVLEPS